MTNYKAVIEIEQMNVTQKKELLMILLSSLVADIEPAERKKLSPTVFLANKEAKPVIEMVEY